MSGTYYILKSIAACSQRQVCFLGFDLVSTLVIRRGSPLATCKYDPTGIIRTLEDGRTIEFAFFFLSFFSFFWHSWNLKKWRCRRELNRTYARYKWRHLYTGGGGRTEDTWWPQVLGYRTRMESATISMTKKRIDTISIFDLYIEAFVQYNDVIKNNGMPGDGGQNTFDTSIYR